jgi:hypothetical protein
MGDIRKDYYFKNSYEKQGGSGPLNIKKRGGQGTSGRGERTMWVYFKDFWILVVFQKFLK